MTRVVALGEATRVTGYAMAGVHVLTAENADAARAAWEKLAEDVGCVLLTRSARDAVAERLAERPQVIWVVVPDVD